MIENVPQGWTVGVFAAVYDDDGRILVSERRDGKGWNLPGGRAEFGKGLLCELGREVLEETGLRIVGRPLLINQYVSEGLKDIAILYTTKVEGKPVPTDESLKHRFVDFQILKREIRLVSQQYPGHGFGRMWAMVKDALGTFDTTSAIPGAVRLNQESANKCGSIRD